MPKRLDKVLYEALIEKGLMSEKQLGPVLKEAEESDISLQQALIKKGPFAEKDILGILADKLKLKFLDLKGISIDKSVINKIPVKIPMIIILISFIILLIAPLYFYMQ